MCACQGPRGPTAYSGDVPTHPRTALPAPALAWLVGPEPVRVVTLGCSLGMVRRLADLGHGVVTVDADPTRIARLSARHQPEGRVMGLVGRPDHLPLQPCVAQVVLVQGPLQVQGEQTVRREAAHSQISRTLQPGGWVAGWRIVRDDSVPWVRRLIALMRSVDPDAMSGSTTDDHEDLLASRYFPRVERRDFRLWLPINRDGLIDMLTSQQPVTQLDDAARHHLIAAASQILESAAPAQEMRLPYTLKCWRAHTDHHELTQPIAFGDGALIIPI